MTKAPHDGSTLDRLTPAETRAHLKLNEHDAYATPYAGVPSRYHMVRNILARYRQATDIQLTAGRDWYPAMFGLLDGVAKNHGLSTHRVIGIFAVTSPGCNLVHNLQATLGVLAGDLINLPCYPAAAIRGQSILSGDFTPVTLDRGNTLDQNRKTKSFYANLMGARKRVTIDRWAQRAAGFAEDGPEQVENGAYLWTERAYQQAGVTAGEDPRTMQAIAWIVERGSDGFDELGINRKG